MNHGYIPASLLGIRLTTIHVTRVGEAEDEGPLPAGTEGTTTTAIEEEPDRPAERVEELVEKVTGRWGFHPGRWAS